MKKRNIAIFLIISILVILGIVKKIQNIYEFPYLYVISDDKKWKAYAYPAYEGGQWTGEMFFLGNKEGDVGKIQYSVKYNGKENQNEKRIYQLSASIGCSVHASDEIDDLNQLIESADKRMYEEKKEKHMRR